MYPFLSDELGLDVFFDNLTKWLSAYMHATGVASRRSAADITLQEELANQKVYLQQSEN